MSDTAKTPEPPSTVVECIPAVRLETGELLTTADEHAAYAARTAPDPAEALVAPAAEITEAITEDQANE